MFESLEAAAPDAILGLIAAFRNDPRTDKVDLGAGVYRDEEGGTPIMRAVKAAERRILESQVTKTYTGSEGDLGFIEAMQGLLLDPQHAAVREGRVWTIQAPGGSGGLRVAAWLLLQARKDAQVWVSDPTWANHIPLLGSTGLKLTPYPYYDEQSHTIRFDAMLETLRAAPRGDIVLLHGSCHNPTGADLSDTQWDALITLLVERELVPFVDMAYLGFADTLERGTALVTKLVDRFPELVLVTSCSKNFALYRDRVGAVTVLARNAEQAKVAWSQAVAIVRRVYSVPPNHGAAVVAEILGDAGLRKQWRTELDQMRARMSDNRRLLVSALEREVPGRDWSHIGRGLGMFSILGLNPAQVERICAEFGVYMVGSSRINIAGVSRANVDYLARAVAAVLAD